MEIEQEEFKVHPSGDLSPRWIASVLPWQETKLCCAASAIEFWSLHMPGCEGEVFTLPTQGGEQGGRALTLLSQTVVR